MPHSSRKKKPQQHKRLQVTDDSGWTHVSTSGKAPRQLLRTTHQADEASLLPAEAPAKVTAEALGRQFESHRRRWEGSEACRVLGETLRRCARGKAAAEAAHDAIVCIGLGSPSGFLRGGWVDRRSVSMYQLAGLVSVVDWMSEFGSRPSFPWSHLPRSPSKEELHMRAELTGEIPPTEQTSPNIAVYAQDPVFNDLDKSLLSSLDITILEHPHAFEKVTAATFLYCPGAEQAHLSQLLALDPGFLFGGPLEDIASEEVRRFVGARGSVRLPRFQEHEHAFWNMRVYFPEETEDDEEILS